MYQQIIEIIAIIFEMNASELSDESNITNVEQWNSMNHMKLILTLEEEFNLSINDDNAIELLSVSDICKFIEERK